QRDLLRLEAPRHLSAPRVARRACCPHLRRLSSRCLPRRTVRANHGHCGVRRGDSAAHSYAVASRVLASESDSRMRNFWKKPVESRPADSRPRPLPFLPPPSYRQRPLCHCFPAKTCGRCWTSLGLSGHLRGRWLVSRHPPPNRSSRRSACVSLRALQLAVDGRVRLLLGAAGVSWGLPHLLDRIPVSVHCLRVFLRSSRPEAARRLGEKEVCRPRDRENLCGCQETSSCHCS
ncbi:hypothetical protein TGCAST_285800B, partial [Toxoplasma gondii CAST]